MPKILIVDDEPATLASIRDFLKVWGFDVLTARGGEEALDICRQDSSIELILSDLVMPDMSGIDLLRTVKDIRPRTHLVVMTGQGAIGSAVEAMKAGALDYLEKPLEPLKLRLTLDRCIRRIETDVLLASLTGPVFLCYAREDADAVSLLYQKLKAARFNPWMDIEDLKPGEQWRDAIDQAIRSASFVLACLSDSSVSKRGMVQKEMRAALEVWQEHLDSDIYLIPVRLTDCAVPSLLAQFQWVDYFAEDGWDKLEAGIRTGLARRASRGQMER